MVFSSPFFLSVFLPIAVVGYFAVPKAWRNGWLLAVSLLFYVWGAGRQIWILLYVITVTYVGAWIVSRLERGSRSYRIGFIVFLVAALAPLVWFKYTPFISENLTYVVGADISLSDLALPIGISFYTFQALSYYIDVSRRQVPPLGNPATYTLFISLFPQLVAGPIVRYNEIRDRLLLRETTGEDLQIGTLRFAHGLFKKVVVADTVAVIADVAFAAPSSMSTTSAWIGAIAYTIQIYFDFSGYSDMAIGLGRIFGFRFPENFNRPYSSVSITDFWRRWHMTLSRWFRDYVYIPLGGSRSGSTARNYFNLVVTFMVTALWHGAAWTFFVWGAIHSVAMLIERAAHRTGIRGQAAIGRVPTLLVVIVAWVFFRSDSVASALTLLEAMFTPSGFAVDPLIAAAADPITVLVLVLACGVFLMPADVSVGSWIDDHHVSRRAQLVYLNVTVVLSLFSVLTTTYSPFLYFQF